MDQIILGITYGFIDFYNSTAFAVVKFLLGIYAAVLFVDIILLLFQRGITGDYRDVMFGMNVPQEFVRSKHKNKLKIQWDALKKKLETGDESEYKSAVLSADAIIDDLLKKMGYGGDDMEERLKNIPKGQIDNLEELEKAHLIKKQMISDKNFKLDREKAEEAILSYEHLLRLFEVLD